MPTFNHLTIPTILLQDWIVPGIVAISDGDSPIGYYTPLHFELCSKQRAGDVHGDSVVVNMTTTSYTNCSFSSSSGL